ncbi:MAG TPA: Uma2 family endonuclease [Gemmata sp.]|jgi:Uma2 family endonuclease|nr:Uma2 family endonuclease [Gemmata sp.]
MTVEEFWDFCNLEENQERSLELVDGEVVELQRPFHRHGVVCAKVAFKLGQYSLWMCNGYGTSNNAGIILQRKPDTVLGPDIAFYEGATLHEDRVTGWSTEPPILVVEILSPNDDIERVIAKRERYLTNGVKIVWQVDYEERNVTVHRPDKTLEVVPESGELTGGNELPGLVISVADLFRLPGDRPAPQSQPQPPVA